MSSTLTSQEIKAHIIDTLIENYKDAGDESKMINGKFIRVIEGYGKRSGFLPKIAGIAYRIWNAIKSIFGRSDWQLLLKAVGSHISKEATRRFSETELHSIPDHLIKQLKLQYESAMVEETNSQLHICLNFINNKNLQNLEELDSSFRKKYKESTQTIDRKYETLLQSTEKQIMNCLI